ncbi:MAG TPA: YchJ family protein [Planctomycetota bacterium]|nr:YchJ family protein [Planctomycetota bacterium]
MDCPCNSGEDYDRCCGPVIRGERLAASAVELMRSRYSAYALGHIDWIHDSQSPDGRQFIDRQATEQWSKRAEWQGLEILEIREGGPDDAEGFVEFKARYTLGGEAITHHEIASFRKEDGKWYFVDGIEMKPRPWKRVEPKLGANDPCSCGSGKKYKKCHGRPGTALARAPLP